MTVTNTSEPDQTSISFHDTELRGETGVVAVTTGEHETIPLRIDRVPTGIWCAGEDLVEVLQ